MAKNIIQDVIVKKKSIRQISIDKGKRSVRNETKNIDIPISGEKKSEMVRVEKRKSAKKRNIPKIIIWSIAFLSIVFLIFSINSFFSMATVTIVPKNASITLDDSYVAKKDAVSDELRFEIMTLQKKLSKQLDATEMQNSEVKASGKIIIYNNFSAVSQRLIINTRLESDNGLIYKIPESITVPGFKIVAGKKIPGSVETLVFADEAGDKYNMKVSDLKEDFKIPGFKGSKKYDYFYARLKTDITGGSSGPIRKVPDKILSEARNELKANIKSELLKEAYASKPQSSVLFSDASYIDYISLPDSSSESGNKIDINESGIFYGIIFDEAELSSYVANKKLLDYDKLPVKLVLDENAVVNISSNNNSKIKPWESGSVSLSMKGKANLVWTYDKDLLRKKLAGQKKSNLKQILSSYPGIKEMRAVIRPFWRQSFPKNIDKIKIDNFSLKK